ncbi:LRR receptor-like serine/threonine-protein kinase FLS2 [Gossypium australe]|uniref:LRR receptor-like serine/threonine-protein kinase FLS2 n=1 Tax=Gossypium australe TaxID=47621 RepID=A0A5B6WNU0_9ROSI|nr:LRR receptor-like serine/threonine-protein kinase FLS2 [Gossypium australe]
MFPPNTMPAQSQPKNEQRPARPNLEKLQFTPIPVSYGELYPKLLEKQMISPHYMAPLKPPYSKWYDPNASCIYHVGNQGHSTENCLSFKRRVQGLIDAYILRFDGASNMAGNPLPNHTEGNMSAMTKEDMCTTRRYHGNMMSTLSYPKVKNSKLRLEVSEVGHFTHSGRCYSPEVVEPRKMTGDWNQKGKAPMHEAEVEFETPSEQEVKRPVNEEEAHEFLKFIKQSEYNVVEQLNKQPARISVLSLLLNHNHIGMLCLKC